MKKIEKIGAALIGLGFLGIAAFAESVEYGLGTFLMYELPCFTLVLMGAILSNEKAGAEAPADNTIKRG